MKLVQISVFLLAMAISLPAMAFDENTYQSLKGLKAVALGIDLKGKPTDKDIEPNSLKTLLKQKLISYNTPVRPIDEFSAQVGILVLSLKFPEIKRSSARPCALSLALLQEVISHNGQKILAITWLKESHLIRQSDLNTPIFKKELLKLLMKFAADFQKSRSF